MLPSTRILAFISLGAFVSLVLLASLAPGLIGTARSGSPPLAIIIPLLLLAVVFFYGVMAVIVRVLFRLFAAVAAIHSPGSYIWTRVRWMADVVILALWLCWSAGLVVAALNPQVRLLFGW